MAKTLVPAICKQCGDEFLARPIDLSRGKAKFCSRACLYLGMQKGTDRPYASVAPLDGGGVRVERSGLYSTLIDECDLNWFLDYPGGWCTSGHGYVQTSRSPITRLHSLIVRPATGQMVDHKNRDTLDNRRANLRCATPSQNQHNCLRSNKHGFKGILFQRDTGKFSGIIKCPDLKRRSIGAYPAAEDAARAHDILAHTWRGAFAYLNFPDRLMTKEEIAEHPRLSKLLSMSQ